MLEVVSLFIICLVTHILDCYVFAKLVREKPNFQKKAVIIILFFSVLDYIISVNFFGAIRIITTNLISFIILKIIYNKSTAKTLVGIIFIYLGYAVAELIYALILYLIMVKFFDKALLDTTIGFVISNIFISIFYLCFYSFSSIIHYVNKIINWCDDKKFLNNVGNYIIIVAMCSIVMFPISFNKLNKVNITIIFSILVGIIVFVVGFFKEKSNNNQLSIKYDNLLDYVKDYEVEVVEKGKAIHEHKNQLAVIDGMIPKTNKKLKEYVSKKLEKVSKLDDNIWLEKLTNLPMGGIKGLVYLKIKKMLENNISIFVEIDSNLKEKNKWNNVNNNLEDYTRVLGVYLDNAIEAAIESKDKQIVLEFIDNKDDIEFILSNTYKGIIKFNNIDKETFSTKGKGRGYGLSLVKDIIDKNNNIKQYREINGKFYVQKLYIKK